MQGYGLGLYIGTTAEIHSLLPTKNHKVKGLGGPWTLSLSFNPASQHKTDGKEYLFSQKSAVVCLVLIHSWRQTRKTWAFLPNLTYLTLSTARRSNCHRYYHPSTRHWQLFLVSLPLYTPKRTGLSVKEPQRLASLSFQNSWPEAQ